MCIFDKDWFPEYRITNYYEVLRINKIVLIADRIKIKYEDFSDDELSLEMIPDTYFYKVYNGLSEICNQIIHYNSPKDFTKNINLHENDIVFTIYGGEKSRNRMGFVPAICEANNIKFVGADMFARSLCQDKFLTKKFCSEFGIETSRAQLIFNSNQLDFIDFLKLPLVVKPNFEGSSIGINDDSLVFSHEAAKQRASQLLSWLNQPIIVEEFIEGKEVCICISGSTNKIDIFEPVEVYNINVPNYFNSNLYTNHVKHKSDEIEHRSISLNLDDAERIKKMFLSIGKMDFMRVDGKIIDGAFRLIELTPDAYLGESSAFEFAFHKNKINYSDMLLSFIRNS